MAPADQTHPGTAWFGGRLGRGLIPDPDQTLAGEEKTQIRAQAGAGDLSGGQKGLGEQRLRTEKEETCGQGEAGRGAAERYR